MSVVRSDSNIGNSSDGNPKGSFTGIQEERLTQETKERKCDGNNKVTIEECHIGTQGEVSIRTGRDEGRCEKTRKGKDSSHRRG